MITCILLFTALSESYLNKIVLVAQAVILKVCDQVFEAEHVILITGVQFTSALIVVSITVQLELI